MRVLAMFAVLLLAFGLAAFAQTGEQTENKDLKKKYLYEWTDREGGVHITDDLGEVPERYRPKARKVELPRGQEVSPGQQDTAGPGLIDTEAQEAAAKAAWQSRMREWKKRLADAEQRYAELDQQYKDTLGMWGGSAASGHLENKVEAERIAQQMKDVQRDIDEAKNMIADVIPEEARRAGVPPGWLRE
jgi:DNA repair exonuclease SbcCD ATPase subunit